MICPLWCLSCFKFLSLSFDNLPVSVGCPSFSFFICGVGPRKGEYRWVMRGDLFGLMDGLPFPSPTTSNLFSWRIPCFVPPPSTFHLRLSVFFLWVVSSGGEAWYVSLLRTRWLVGRFPSLLCRVDSRPSSYTVGLRCVNFGNSSFVQTV